MTHICNPIPLGEVAYYRCAFRDFGILKSSVISEIAFKMQLALNVFQVEYSVVSKVRESRCLCGLLLNDAKRVSIFRSLFIFILGFGYIIANHLSLINQLF